MHSPATHALAPHTPASRAAAPRPAHRPLRVHRKVAIVSTFPPRPCGIATFTRDLRDGLAAAAPDLEVVVCAVDRDGLDYGPEVAVVLDQDDRADHRRAAARLAAQGVDAVLIQHEFGIFGGPDGAWINDFAAALTASGIPYLVTAHTVLSQPSPGQAEALRRLCRDAAAVTVFTPTAQRLAAQTGIVSGERVHVVPHGAPALLSAHLPGRTSPVSDAVSNSVSHTATSSGSAFVPAAVSIPVSGSVSSSVSSSVVDPVSAGHAVVTDATVRPEIAETLDRLRAAGATVVSTFGLISPNKGLHTGIAAVAELARDLPGLHYVIAGATHPEVVRRHGEVYRETLHRTAVELGVRDRVHFLDHFLTDAEIAALLRHTDVFLTPYASSEQISSGALTFALGAGVPAVSTAYHYACDMLNDGAGRTVPPGDDRAFTAALRGLLTEPGALARATAAARAISERLPWPVVAERFAGIIRSAAAPHMAVPHDRWAPHPRPFHKVADRAVDRAVEKPAGKAAGKAAELV